MRKVSTAAVVMALLTSLPAGVQPAPPVVATQDASAATPGGAVFTLPKSWTLRTLPAASVIDAPEGDLHIAIVDVGAAADASQAAAAAWKIYRPEATRTAKLVTPRAARDGWEARSVVDYETSPNEKAYITAVALRHQSSWTILIVDGSEATTEKRSAALNLVSASLRPKGYNRETFAGRTAAPMNAARVKLLTDFLQESMQQLDIPGVGFALIERGKVIYEGGLGVRDVRKPLRVDAHTRFMIASNTKGMSTLLLSRLVDAGKLKWDDPVTKVYPAFRLGSDATTKQVLIRHLVCACTGLPRKDLEWLFNTRRDTPASTTFTQLASTQPTSGFGEVFQYNNLMASAAGYVGGYIAYPKLELGAAYDKAMQTLIFDPLGMKETVFPIKAALKSNYAAPHGNSLDSKTVPIPMDFNYSVMPYRPAGAAWSSAHDMIRYVALELSEGVLPNGKRLVSAENLLARRAHSVPEGEDQWYGMGLSDDRTSGISVIHHGGSMFGYKSDWVAIPEAGVGAVLLTNSESGQALLRPFRRRLLEILYNGKPEAAADVAAAGARRKPETDKLRERLVIPPAADVMAGLASAYTNPDLGRMDVRRIGKDVIFSLTTGSSKISSRKNEDGTISLVSIDPELLGIEWVIGTQNGKSVLTVRDSQHEYIFVPVTG